MQEEIQKEETQPVQNGGNPYLPVIIFLVALAIVGAVVLIANKSGNSSSQSDATSANITSDLTESEVATPEANTLPTVEELKIEDQVIGTGTAAESGKKVTVNYTGTLMDGTAFDSNVDQNFGHVEPFVFTLGAGEVIQGWDQGVAGMRVGGKRKLTIPSSLAYGDGGIPGAIPGGATLVFEVELLKVE